MQLTVLAGFRQGIAGPWCSSWVCEDQEHPVIEELYCLLTHVCLVGECMPGCAWTCEEIFMDDWCPPAIMQNDSHYNCCSFGVILGATDLQQAVKGQSHYQRCVVDILKILHSFIFLTHEDLQVVHRPFYKVLLDVPSIIGLKLWLSTAVSITVGRCDMSNL